VRTPCESDPSSETRQERTVRLHHCFMPDGLFVLMAIYFAVALCKALSHSETLGSHSEISSIVGLSVSSGYVLGNMFFLQAMRWRSQVAVRIAIANHVSFMLALATMLINGGWHGSWTVARVLSYMNRLFVVLFFAMGVAHILPLWNSPVYMMPGDSCTFEMVGLVLVAVVALAVWALLIVAAWNSEDAVWEVAMNGA
jgi:hypothetical protein